MESAIRSVLANGRFLVRISPTKTEAGAGMSQTRKIRDSLLPSDGALLRGQFSHHGVRTARHQKLNAFFFDGRKASGRSIRHCDCVPPSRLLTSQQRFLQQVSNLPSPRSFIRIFFHAHINGLDHGPVNTILALSRFGRNLWTSVLFKNPFVQFGT